MESRINDVQIGLSSVLIWACWGGGITLIMLDVIGVEHRHLGLLGLTLVAIGHLRSTARMFGQLEHREARAYEIGERDGAAIRPIH